MAYTPVGWQTGDTITADRLNRMDRGWGYEATELFSETVTTAEQGGMYGAALAYSETIDADTLTVTFDGTEYVCSRIDKFGNHFYGGFSEQGPVFTECPFYLVSNRNGNTVYTETASTHTVAASVASLQTSADFDAAVSMASPIDASLLPFRCVPDVTTYAEMEAAVDAGRLLYFYPYSSGGLHLVMSFQNEASETAVTAYPEGQANVETYGFNSDMVFSVFIY